jgi:hypothetical protein
LQFGLPRKQHVWQTLHPDNADLQPGTHRAWQPLSVSLCDLAHRDPSGAQLHMRPAADAVQGSFICAKCSPHSGFISLPAPASDTWRTSVQHINIDQIILVRIFFASHRLFFKPAPWVKLKRISQLIKDSHDQKPPRQQAW